MVRKKAIEKKLLINTSLIVLLQGFVFIVAIFNLGILNQITENSINSFCIKAESIKAELDYQFNSNWTNNIFYRDMQTVMQEAYNNAQKSPNQLIDIYKSRVPLKLLETQYKIDSTGLFIISEKNIGKENYEMLYLRNEFLDNVDDKLSKEANKNINYKDINYKNIKLAIGGESVPKFIGIETSQDYSPDYDASQEDIVEKFKLLKAKCRFYKNEPPENLGVWVDSIKFKGEKDIAVYLVPFIDEKSGNVYGAFGVEVSEDYLRKILKDEINTDKIQDKQNKRADKKSKYITAALTRVNKNDRIYKVIANAGYETNPPLTRQGLKLAKYSGVMEDLFEGSMADVGFEKSKKGIYLLESPQLKSKTVVFKNAILNSNYTNVFIDNKWILCVLIPESKLSSYSDKILGSLLGALLISLIIGLIGSMFNSIIMSKPIKRLVKDLNRSDRNKTVRLNRVGIDEIDNLIKSIEVLSQDVANSASRMDKIIGVSNILVGAIEFDKKQKVAYILGKAAKMLNFSSQYRNEPVLPWEVFAEELKKFLLLSTVYERGSNNAAIYEYKMSGRRSRYISFSSSIIDENKTFIVILDETNDVLEKQKIELERDYDILTGLLNRNAFKSKVNAFIRNNPNTLGVMAMWDLDHLKVVNDVHGHDSGDFYIKKMAELLSNYFTENAYVSRISGDEFYVFCYGPNSKDVLRKKMFDFQKEIKKIDKVKLPNGRDQKFSASGGFAWYPDDAEGYSQLSKYADFAMYQAKRPKGGIIEFDKSAYDEDEILFNGLEKLNQFIEKREVKFAFQPIVSAITGEVFAYEALMRPQNENFKNVGDVMRVVKAHSKQYAIERLTWFGALEDHRKQGEIFTNTRLFINSIPNTVLRDEEFVEFQKQYKNVLNRLVIEIVENERSDRACMERKQRLREDWGCSLAVDDFGSGYANESSLLYINPDFVKIDMDLIRGIDTDTHRQKIVSNIISYKKDTHIKIICEGVETKGELETVIRLGADLIQGFYLARPQFDLQDIPKERKEEIRMINLKRDMFIYE